MFSNTPHLVVIREANPNDGTNLHEFWRLEASWWRQAADDDTTIENPVLKMYVAPWNGTRDTGRDGLPPKDKRAGDSCQWSEVPEEVRDQFRQEANEIQAATSMFQAPTEE